MSHVLITGATGMVGKGVLIACLKDPSIEKITVVGRRNLLESNPKIQEIILSDFSELNAIRTKLSKVDACFHCMGVSSLGISAEDYHLKTFEYTKYLADVCFDNNPEMTFCYVSGAGTSSSENSRQVWVNVKGKTENYLIKKAFQRVFLFRPGIILPEDGIQSATPWYNYIYRIMRPFFGLLKKSKHVTSTRRIGAAMIRVSQEKGPMIQYLENPQINQWSQSKT